MAINNAYRFNTPSGKVLDDEIERLIDAYGLKRVLSQFSEICGQKAEHIAVNWQDAHTAKPWAKMATVLEQAVKAAEAYGV